MARQRSVGLLAVPGAIDAQTSHEVDEVLGSGTNGPQLGKIDAGQVVGISKAIERIDVNREDLLISQAEVVQDHRRGPQSKEVGIDRQLDGREHLGGMTLGEDDRPRAAEAIGHREGVDHPQLARHCIDPQGSDDEVHEGKRGDDLNGDLLSSSKQLDGPLRHQRRPWDAVDDTA